MGLFKKTDNNHIEMLLKQLEHERQEKESFNSQLIILNNKLSHMMEVILLLQSEFKELNWLRNKDIKTYWRYQDEREKINSGLSNRIYLLEEHIKNLTKK